jgi:hypothetical protein
MGTVSNVGSFKSGRFGDISDYFAIDTGGVATLVGTAQRKLTLRPQIASSQLVRIGASTQIIPTPVAIGPWTGFSMPIWSADGDSAYEQLFFRLRVPQEWNGTTNSYFSLIVALSDLEDVGDKFQLQLYWNNTSVTGAIEVDGVTQATETTIITSHAAQYSTYIVRFELDYDNAGLQQTMVSGNNLVGRIRRIAATSLEVTNEVIILDWVSEWYINKLYGEW